MEAVEAALKKSDLAPARALLKDAAHPMRVVLDGLRPLAEQADESWDSGDAGVQETAFDPAEVSRRLVEMADLVEMDINGARTGLDELKTLMGPRPEIRAIAEALDDYDSDEAMAGIQALAERLDLKAI